MLRLKLECTPRLWVNGLEIIPISLLTDTYTLPKMLIEDPFKLEAFVSENVETVDMTEEDYIRAAGIDQEDDND